MEQLLHYVWKHKLFPLKALTTTNGLPVEVIDPGLPNTNAGPDFFNAKVRIDGTMWVGNVEVHTLASDWHRHGHDSDRKYDSVVLHVVGTPDCQVCRTNGEPIPQLALPCPDHVVRNYRQLLQTDRNLRCRDFLPDLPRLSVHSWMAALQAERFQQKAQQVEARLQRCNGNWEDAFFVTLARNFGFGLNGDTFEQWAERIPLRAVDKHRDNLFQIEAIFFGQAGLLDGPTDDAYSQQLQREYAYLRHKFDLQPLEGWRWSAFRSRPGNFPHVRLAQLAMLYYQEQSLFSRVMEAATTMQAKALLASRVSDYWETHYLFGRTSPRRAKTVSPRSLDLVLINTVVPFLYTYGTRQGNEALRQRATTFLEELKPEQNHIIRMWQEAGLPAENAADTQALIQLKKAYCDPKKCLQCRFGFEYLRRKRTTRAEESKTPPTPAG